jgi:hypothetical protein
MLIFFLGEKKAGPKTYCSRQVVIATCVAMATGSDILYCTATVDHFASDILLILEAAQYQTKQLI